ncbi:MAG: aminotransferase class I/II-fold pyridoxal phosphate-dependent enzyme [Acidobacteriota bacterium]
MSFDPATLGSLSLEEKRRLARELLDSRREEHPAYTDLTYDMAMHSTSAEHAESRRFGEWLKAISEDDAYSFEAPRLGGQRTEVDILRESGEVLHVLNFGSYNYLGYSHHPEVIAAAKEALDRYGLGAGSSPILSGTLKIHRELEGRILEFLGLEGRAVSLFSSGYAVNTGTISSFVKQGHCVVLDRSVHMSIQEGAQLSKARTFYFRHNDVGNLEQVLRRLAPENTRVLVCTEGVFSADGDRGRLAEIVELSHRYGAQVLVDEAHSILVAGPGGRGVGEEQGVLRDIDLLVLTFSKAFGGVGGALVAREEMARYVNWYARCRMFSCALDPAVAGGLIKVLELAAGSDGGERRERVRANAARLRSLLADSVSTGVSESWIVPVMYGLGRLTFPLNDFLQKTGLETNIMQFPAVPKDESRIRLFVTAEHTDAQIDRAVSLIRQAAQRFGFAKEGT